MWLEQVAKASVGAGLGGFDGCPRHAQGLTDLGTGETGEAEFDDRAMRIRNVVERGDQMAELVLMDGECLGIGVRIGDVVCVIVERDGWALFAVPIDDGVVGDAEEPGAEGAAVGGWDV